LQIEPKHILIASIVSLGVGLGYGFLWFNINGLGIIGWILSFIIGRGAGELIAKTIHHKKGLNITVIVLLAVGFGILLSPLEANIANQVIFLFEAMGTHQNMYGETSTWIPAIQLIFQLIPISLFLRGIQSAS
jgi:hypothetical protein